MIKCKKIVVIISCIVCGFIAVVLVFGNGGRSRKPEFLLSSYRRVTFATGEDFRHVAEMDKILAGLSKGKRFVWTKPDLVLLLYSSSSSEPRFLSIFLKEGFVFEGYYLDAWAERMEDKKSSVYLLNAEKQAQIEAYLRNASRSDHK
jgi:hypothetical protein